MSRTEVMKYIRMSRSLRPRNHTKISTLLIITLKFSITQENSLYHLLRKINIPVVDITMQNQKRRNNPNTMVADITMPDQRRSRNLNTVVVGITMPDPKKKKNLSTKLEHWILKNNNM